MGQVAGVLRANTELSVLKFDCQNPLIDRGKNGVDITCPLEDQAIKVMDMILAFEKHGVLRRSFIPLRLDELLLKRMLPEKPFLPFGIDQGNALTQGKGEKHELKDGTGKLRPGPNDRGVDNPIVAEQHDEIT